MIRHSNLSGLLLASLGLMVALGAATPDDRVNVPVTAGGKVSVEVYKPAGAGPFPAIVIAYGTQGMENPSGDAIRDFASQLRANGFVALIPDYFASTGTQTGRPALGDASSKADVWAGVLNDCLAYAANRADVKKGSLGLLGFSLGGHVVLRAGKMTVPVHPQAVVEFAAPTTVLGGVGGNLDKLPPLQIHHGLKDEVVKPVNTTDLVTLMAGITPAPDVHWYKEEAHVPFTPAGTKESTKATVAFFQKYLP